MNLELPDEEFIRYYGHTKEDAPLYLAMEIKGLVRELNEVLEWQRSHHQPALDYKGTRKDIKDVTIY